MTVLHIYKIADISPRVLPGVHDALVFRLPSSVFVKTKDQSRSQKSEVRDPAKTRQRDTGTDQDGREDHDKVRQDHDKTRYDKSRRHHKLYSFYYYSGLVWSGLVFILSCLVIVLSCDCLVLSFVVSCHVLSCLALPCLVLLCLVLFILCRLV